MTNEDAIALIKEALTEIAPTKAAEFSAANLDMKIRDMGIDT